jgi:hypothetical protein
VLRFYAATMSLVNKRYQVGTETTDLVNRSTVIWFGMNYFIPGPISFSPLVMLSSVHATVTAQYELLIGEQPQSTAAAELGTLPVARRHTQRFRPGSVPLHRGWAGRQRVARRAACAWHAFSFLVPGWLPGLLVRPHLRLQRGGRTCSDTCR